MSSSAKHTAQPKTAKADPMGKPKQAVSTSYVKKEKKIVMNPTSNLDVMVSSGNNSGLREPIMIAFGIPGSKVVQYTIHRKIGVDPLIPDEGWVLSQSTDVIGFLENQKDERVPLVNKQIATMRTDHLLRTGALVKSGDRIVYAHTDIERSKARNEASRLFEAYKKEDPKGTRKLESFFVDSIAEKEAHIAELLTEPGLMERIEKLKKSLESFVTMGGPSADRRQKEVPTLRGVTTKGKIIAKVIQLLWSKATVREGVTEETQVQSDEDKDTEKDLEGLKSDLADLQETLREKREILKGVEPGEQADTLSDEIVEIRENIKEIRRQITEIEDDE